MSIKNYNAEYYAKNKERIAERRKNFYQENKDRIDAAHNKWVENNRDKWNAYIRERREKAKLDKKRQA